MSSTSQPPPLASRLKVTFTVLFHSSCAISVTLVSKSALNGLDLPITLLALQSTVQVVLLSCIGGPLGWVRFHRPLAAWQTLTPLTLARFIGILAKTYCLASVNASIYQIARGLLLPFSLLLSHFLLVPRPYNPPLSLFGCFIIMCGFGIGMVTDLRGLLTSTRGIVLGVGSSFTTAVESVVVKRFMSKRDEGMWQLVWMSSLMQLALYTPLLYVSGELEVLAMQTAEVWTQFVKTAITTGMAGFLLTLATFLQISVTSPTTHMIVTAARGVAQSALAVAVFGEKVTDGRLLGMGCILGGSMVYGWRKGQAGNQEQERVANKSVGQVDVEMGEKGSEQK